MSERRIDRALLPRTFGAWFARFPSLSEVQRLAIPPLVEGRDVLLAAPTASGKTEAFAAPAAELAARRDGASATALLVSPTRALANDLARRLAGPMESVGVRFGRYTGEHKELRAGSLAAVVVTTPEALDSLLARRATLLEETRLIVVDELHVLDGTARGDQLRVLLERLERNARERPQRAAASATIEDPAGVALRYLEDPVLALVPGARRMLCRFFEGAGLDALARHLDQLAEAGFKKLLVFCRSRNEVELYSAKLLRRTRFAEAVFAHHGSLARGQRERVERSFQQLPAAVCFATLTLELGIDVGSVDYVLSVGPPNDVASLLQRTGRGARRAGLARGGFALDGPSEVHVVRTQLELAREGRLCAAPYAFRPSVLVQQAWVLACARRWVEASDLEAILPAEVRAELGSKAVPSILERLAEEGSLEAAGNGRYVPSEGVERRYELGYLHANIDEAQSLEVVDRLTGDSLGHVESASANEIQIGGGERRIVGQRGERILTDRGSDAAPARFTTRPPPAVAFALARAVVEALAREGLVVEPDCLLLVPAAPRWILVHGLGTAGARLLRRLLGAMLGREQGGRWSPYTLELAAPLAELPRPTEALLARFVESELDALADLAAPGPHDPKLPRSLRLASLRRILALDPIADFLRSARLAHAPEPAPNLLRLLRAL